MPACCKRFFVSGKVQGVWFRDFTKRKARQLKITGSATNLADGRVEVIACGSEESLQMLSDWLNEGSPLSEVDQVMAEDMPYSELTGFVTA